MALLILFTGASLLRAEEQPRFILHTASGEDHVGSLKQIGEGWKTLLLEGEDFARASAADLISLRREKTALPPPPAGEHLILANGDTFPGQLVELIGENLGFKSGIGKPADLKLPLSAVSVLWITAPEGTEHPDRLRRALARGKRSRDAVYLRNGDVLEGVLAALDRKKVQIEVEKKEVTVEFDKVAAVAMNTDLARLPAPKGPHARIVLANGSRVTLAAVKCDGRTLTGPAAFGGDVQAPVSELVSLQMHGGVAEYLSDLKPTRYESKSLLGSIRWPYVADGNVWEGDLRLGGSTYDKGVGMHAEGKLTYALDGNYRRFETRVGLDDQSPEAAAARLRVVVDGKEQDLGPASELKRRGPARTLRIDVRGAKELTLVVDLVPRVGAVPGDVDWGDARVIRK